MEREVDNQNGVVILEAIRVVAKKLITKKRDS